MSERKEAWMRIVVLIVSGIILGIWKGIIQILIVLQWLIAVIGGKRVKGLAEFCEIFNTQMYRFIVYMTFVTNERPFPFTKLAKSMSKFNKGSLFSRIFKK